ncbi:hypothetical protein [Granulicella arctica]|uniref:Uncharacterized protein n=1 Tax=Granulicella arctica TaxID=940613 RepID=A0A7Y9PGG3_9BACT|nr:hypothetical protein [Granulicella arctica]NYF79463.1 hypothetical protein [Granulicella arctica]
MFHKNALNSARSISTALPVPQEQYSQQNPSNPVRLTLVSSGSGGTPQTQAVSSSLVDLIAISAHRCSAFFAEAAVLVLVLALLDRFMAKGRMEMGWIVSAFAISLVLLAASIVTDFTARRWLKAH